MAMQGNLKDMHLADLIQYICADRKITARLTVQNGTREAVLFFEEGNPTHATSGELEGEEAVYDALTWADGTFALDNNVKPPTQSIERGWKYLLLEGMRRFDEQQKEADDQLMASMEEFTSDNQFNDSQFNKENDTMSNINETLAQIMNFDGAIATALVDWKSGMTLGTAGGGIDIEMAAAGNTQVVRAKMQVMKDTKIKGGIEDILITLTEHYHLIRMLESNPSLFIYVAVHRDKANLGLVRLKLADLEKNLTI